jgi:RNA polymerase sigma-54 factor
MKPFLPQLILAPRMILSMEILRLPNRSLWERVQWEIRENPVLVMLEPATSSSLPETEGEAPDAVVEQAEGGYDVRVLDAWTRAVRIDTRYAELSDDGAVFAGFLRRRVQQAGWLVEALELRRGILKKVIRAIVRQQRTFLDEGPEHLVRCTMQGIADEAGVHITTVSRAGEDKRLQTAQGIFPLRCFFAGPENDNGRAEPERCT